MIETEFIIFISYLMTFGHCKMIPFIINGQNASVTDFPYNAHLSIKCFLPKSNRSMFCVCGSSILNQYLTLTAAHCTATCSGKVVITVYVGHELKSLAAVSSVHSYYNHRQFEQQTLKYDISLIRLKTALDLNSHISRVAIIKNPPYYEEAVVTGWGYPSASKKKTFDILRYTKQWVQNNGCQNLLKFHHKEQGTICARSKGNTYIANGDSGSPLVVRGYIQIGIVSYRYECSKCRNACIYTDTGYFHDWIQKVSRQIMCIK